MGKSALSNRLVVVSLGCEWGWNLKTHSDKEYTLIIPWKWMWKRLDNEPKCLIVPVFSRRRMSRWWWCVRVYMPVHQSLSLPLILSLKCVHELFRHSTTKAMLTKATQQSRTTWPKHKAAAATTTATASASWKARASKKMYEWIKYI